MNLSARLDLMAEELERAGHTAFAAVIDNVSEELAEREACANGTCADGTCADENGQCADGSVATAAANFPSFKQPDTEPTGLLTGSANRLLEATRQYGAKSCRIEGQAVELVLDRGEVETTAALEFCSRDEAGKPQLRMTFRCGGDKMVRWASLDSFDADALTSATQHVFGTGQNYGANVVTAKASKPTVEMPRKCARSDTQHGRRPVCDADALKVSRAMTALVDEIATASATWLVAKKVSREPYQRALDRIRSLEERGVDVEKHTLLRLSKTSNVDKIEGLWQAAMHAGLGRVASEAKKKFRQLTGKNPIKW